MKRSLTILFFLSAICCNATNYHLAASGNDGNDGITLPWQTLAKAGAATATMNAGDSLLLNRGDVFTGSLRITKSGVHIGAYGDGNMPVINGLAGLSLWTSTGGGIYECLCPNCRETQHIVTVNGVNTGMGRWPNYGYKYVTAAGSNYLVDNSLSASPNWTGATAVVRVADWITDIDTIKLHNTDTLYIAANTTQHSSIGGYGYFIQNDVRTLDTLGEWYYDKTNKKIQMYFGGQSPSSYNVATSIVDTLVYLNGLTGVTFDNIAFTGSNLAGLQMDGVRGIRVKNCSLNFHGRDGIWARNGAGNSDSVSVEYTTVKNVNNNAINLESKYNYAKIRYDSIVNTSVLVGMGMGDNNAGLAVVSSGKKPLYEYNFTKNTGYIACRMDGDSFVVQNSFFDSSLINKDDGGAIYSYYGPNPPAFHGRKILNNIILHSVGAKEGSARIFTTGSDPSIPAEGIYADDGTNGIDIIGNTIADCAGKGMFFHNSSNINFFNNTLINNGTLNSGQIYYSGSASNINVRKNIFFIKATQTFIGQYLTDMTTVGSVDSNYLVNPFSNSIPYFGNKSFAQWLATYGYDAHSTSPAKISTTSRLEYNSTNKIKLIWLDGTYYDAIGRAYSNSVFINPHTSLMLMKLNGLIKLKGGKITIRR